MVIVDNAIDITHQRIMPAPLLSATVDDCIEKGKDIIQGGRGYNYVGLRVSASPTWPTRWPR